VRTVRARTAATAVAIVTLAVLAFAPVAGAHPNHPNAATPSLTETSTCRASVVRVTAPILGTIEPTVVQNTAGQSCQNQSATLIGPLAIPGVLLLSVGTASSNVSGTVNHPNPASALVVDLRLGVPLLPAISVALLGSTSSALECTGPFGSPTSRPRLTSGGAVGALSIGGAPPAPILSDPVDINLIVAQLSLNRIVQTPQQITRQALRLSVPLLGIEVVIAETKAGWVGNPCDGHT
jgi:hypothetical protein